MAPQRGLRWTAWRSRSLTRSRSAEEFNRRIRAHWQIENQCHWLLDVVFHEDDARLHVGHGAHNFAILRRIVLNLIKKEKSTKASVKHKRASWSPDYLEMLFGLTSA